jgi:hypothetical protein
MSAPVAAGMPPIAAVRAACSTLRNGGALCLCTYPKPHGGLWPCGTAIALARVEAA